MTLAARKKQHLKMAGHRAGPTNHRARRIIAKYKNCSVVFRVLQVFKIGVVEGKLRRAEARWIKKFLKEFSRRRVLNMRTVEVSTNLGLRWSNRRWTVKEKKIRALSKRVYFENPVNRAKHSDAIRALWKDPTYRERMCVARKKAFSTPEHRAYLSKRATEQWADGVSEETRKRMSISALHRGRRRSTVW